MINPHSIWIHRLEAWLFDLGLLGLRAHLQRWRMRAYVVEQERRERGQRGDQWN